MNIYFHILIFLIILFLYLHLVQQYKRSEDLEVYEMDYTSKEHLHRVCAMKQPILFQYVIPEDVLKEINDIGSIGEQELEIWDIRDYERKPESFLLPYKSFENLVKSDPKGVYFTRKNEYWLEESGGLENIRVFDDVWKPVLSANSGYDIWMGSEKAHTPLEYHMDDHLYLYVTKGKISVKMTPWRSRKFFEVVKDFENFEFYAKENPWISEGTIQGVRWLDFEVVEGYVLYIPAWWWFSIRFSSSDCRVVGFRYQTFGNILAHIPDWMRYYYQYHTTKQIVTKTLDISEMGTTERVIKESI